MSDAESVKKMLRSVLQSSKAGVSINRLQAEYRSLCGEMIPLRRLGYGDLESYLRSVPSAVRLENRMGELTCFAAVCKETAHIAELVARQKSTKKASRSSHMVNCRMRPSPARLYMPNVTPRSFLRQPSSSRPSRPNAMSSRSGVSASGDWRQLNQSLNGTVPVQHRVPVVSPPSAQVNRGPVVSFPPVPLAQVNWGPVISKWFPPSAPPAQVNRRPVVSPPPAPPAQLNRPNSSPSVIGTEKSSFETPADQVQSRLSQLLAKYCSGLWRSKLPDVYKQMFNEQLHPQTLIDLENWTHICQVERLVNRADCLVYPPLPAKHIPVSTNTARSPTPKPSTSPPAGILTPSPTPKSPLASPTFLFPPKPVDTSPVKPVHPAANSILSSAVTPPSSSSCPPSHFTLSPLSPRDVTLTPVASPPPVSIAPPPVSVSPDVRVKLKELLSKYAQGLWALALPKLFLDTYKTAFPEQVQSHLAMLPDMCTVEYPFPNNKNKAILYSSDLDLKQHKSHVGPGSSPLIPSGLCVRSPVVPPPLETPKEQFASALVTDAKDCTAVTVRYVGDNYSKALEAMEDTMRSFYSQSSAHKPMSSPSMGQLAAVQGEDGDELARAQIVTVLPSDKVMVYYVDYGFSEETKRSNLLELHEDFLTLPFQATNVRLAGLESLGSHKAVLASLDTLAVGKILLIEFVERCAVPLVVLYDTSQDDDVNINQLCLKAVQDRTMDNPLTVNSTYQEVCVTNVCSDGTLHCQLPSRGTVKLNELLDKIQAFFLSQVTSESLVSRPYYGKLCLSRYKDKWSRAEITNIHGNRVMDIVFIDLGIPASVSVTELREIPTPFLNDLTIIPPQAIKCCLADLTDGPLENPETVLWLREAILYTTNCSMKIVKLDQVKEDKLVHIYLYPNSCGGDLDNCINHQLAQSEMWLRLTEQNNNVVVKAASPNHRLDSGDDSTAVERLSRPSLRPINSSYRDQPEVDSPFSPAKKTPAAVEEPLSLPPPLEAPQAGQNFDVYVSVALHPGYFVVQPWQELYKLSVLMGEMALYYNRTQEDAATDTPVHKGHVYAGKVDKTWHRVIVKGVLTNGLVSIYELDYGKHELVNSTQLQPLIEEFRQLPFQAITAQLAGVGAQQWSEEASNLFRNHVEKRALVAQVISVQEGPEVWARRLTVYLVDTTQDNSDVWIHKIMADIAEKLPTTTD